MAEHNREKKKLYQQKKREQARLRLHQDPLAQLADVVNQQEYLQDAAVVLVVPESPANCSHTILRPSAPEFLWCPMTSRGSMLGCWEDIIGAKRELAGLFILVSRNHRNC
jgi:hypothetical protein